METLESEVSEFVEKYGPVKFKFIDGPKENPLFTRPVALNYFHDGHLFRTRGERTSSRFELFFDLLYVGIVANLAKNCTEKATGLALLEYILLFVPAYMVWSGVREFMNYYYNNDFLQKTYVMFILALLVMYCNNAPYVLESHKGTAMVVGPYVIARLTTNGLMFFYSFYAKEHSVQIRSYFAATIVTSATWLAAIWVDTRGKIAVASVCIIVELSYAWWFFHPSFKRLAKLTYSTALNIEHEVERTGAFYIIALGEFLYGIVADAPTGMGFTMKLARAVMTVIIAYNFLWFYFNGNGSDAAIHALRRSATSASLWLYLHLPLVMSLLLAADAAADMSSKALETTKKHPSVAIEERSEGAESSAEGSEGSEESEEPTTFYSLQFFFTGGLCIALFCITAIALLDKDRDKPGHKRFGPAFRVLPRIPVGIVILCLAFAQMKTTLLMGITALLTTLLHLFEIYASMRTESDNDTRKTSKEVAEAQVDLERAQEDLGSADLERAQEDFQRAEADIERAEVDLERVQQK